MKYFVAGIDYIYLCIREFRTEFAVTLITADIVAAYL